MTPTLEFAELWRLLAVLDMAVLFGCAVYLHAGYGRDLPSPLYRLGYVYGALLVLIVVATVANWLSAAPPTVGVRIFAAVGVVLAAIALRVTVRAARGTDPA